MKILIKLSLIIQAPFVLFLLIHHWRVNAISNKDNEGAVEENPAGIGLTPSEVLDIQSSEMETELTSLLQLSDPSATLSSAAEPSGWLTQTSAIWDTIKKDSEEDGCEYKKYNSATPMNDQLFPLMVCNRSPAKSGNERRQILDDLVAVVEEPMDESQGMMMMGGNTNMPMNHVTPNIFIRGLVSSAKILYNQEDKTCWIMTATSCLAMKLYANAVQSDGLIQVQPILPMMKIRKGTIDTLSTALSSKGQTLKINFDLSPSTLEFDSIKFSVSQWLLDGERNSKTSQKQFKDTFPYTSMETQLQGGFLNGEDPVAFLWPHITPMYLRNQISLQINLNSLYPGRGYSIAKTADLQANDETQDAEIEDKIKIALLVVISAVASKGEIVSAEIRPDAGLRGLRGSYPSI